MNKLAVITAVFISFLGWSQADGTSNSEPFVETVEKIVDTKMEIPVQGSFLGPKEKYEILENDMDTIKKFIESKL